MNAVACERCGDRGFIAECSGVYDDGTYDVVNERYCDCAAGAALREVDGYPPAASRHPEAASYCAAHALDVEREARIAFANRIQEVAVERGGTPGFGFLAGVCSLRVERGLVRPIAVADTPNQAGYRRAFGNPIPRLPEFMPAAHVARYLTWYEAVWTGEVRP